MLFQFGFGYDFQSFIYYLDVWGLRDVILPFLLFFAVLFGLLQKVDIFGKDSKKFNVIISLVISLLVIIPHVTGAYPAGADVVNIVNQALPEIALLIIIITMVLVLVGILGGKKDATESGFLGLIALLGVIGLVVIFLRAFTPGYTPSWLYFLDDPGFQMLIVVLLVFGLIVWFITKGTDTQDTKPPLEWFRKLLGGR